MDHLHLEMGNLGGIVILGLTNRIWVMKLIEMSV